MNKRKLSLKKYGISKNRYNELAAFCKQYREWKEKLIDLDSNLRGIEYTDMPMYHTNADTTMNIAIKREELTDKCRMIEDIALEAGGDMSKFLIRNVCYEVPVNYLIANDHMPLSPNTFYDMRRYFFWLLNQCKK